MTIPLENENTYRWRGDLGILDRLSYGNSKGIPHNWKMTSVNPAAVVQSQSASLELPSSSIPMIADYPLAEDIASDHFNMSAAARISTQHADTTMNALQEPKKKRYSRAPKKAKGK
jgi:hypothetical protein